MLAVMKTNPPLPSGKKTKGSPAEPLITFMTCDLTGAQAKAQASEVCANLISTRLHPVMMHLAFRIVNGKCRVGSICVKSTAQYRSGPERMCHDRPCATVNIQKVMVCGLMIMRVV